MIDRPLSRSLDRRQMLGRVLAAGSLTGLAWQTQPWAAAAADSASGSKLGLNLATVRYYTAERPASEVIRGRSVQTDYRARANEVFAG